VRKDGGVQLPKEALEALGAGPGSYLSVAVEGERIVLAKTAFDPWAEGQKKAASHSFDEILERQQAGLAEAEKDFMEKLKKPPEVRPEDRPEFWD
jgi:antitoxin component of MazEF toxin-antitoxin module